MRRHGTRESGIGRRGVAVVEFAVIAPVFFLLIFGIIEFGRAVMVQQVLTNASREGARRAIIEGETNTTVKNLVETYLTNASVNDATVTVSPNTLSDLAFGDEITVTVSVPFQDVSWVASPWFLGSTTLTASTTMHAERLQ